MFSFVWPIALAVIANTIYQICAKSLPADINPLASLTVTYGVAAIASALLYYLLNKDADLLREYSHLNWAPFVLGVVIIGLEAGMLYAYRAGWQVSVALIVESAFLAVILLLVGFLIYHEAITWSKVIGILICLVGLYFVNR